jgi:SnoaL-like protein
MIVATETTLLKLANESEIQRTINRYFQALDEKRLDAGSLAEIFAPDAKVTRPNGSTTVGPGAIGESHTHSLGRFRATQHLTSGFIVTLVNDTEARFRGNLVALHLWCEGQGDPSIDPNENYFLAGGIVTGRVVLLADGWRIAEIAMEVIWRRGVGFQQMLKETK